MKRSCTLRVVKPAVVSVKDSLAVTDLVD
jgi:hypothetical protein